MPTTPGDARATVRLGPPRGSSAKRTRVATARPHTLAGEAASYWAFFLWVVMIAAGMWPPFLVPLVLAAFPTPLIAARALWVLGVWVRSRERGRGGGGGGRGGLNGGVQARAPLLPPAPSPSPSSPSPRSAPPPPGACACAATSCPARQAC